MLVAIYAVHGEPPIDEDKVVKRVPHFYDFIYPVETMPVVEVNSLDEFEKLLAELKTFKHRNGWIESEENGFILSAPTKDEDYYHLCIYNGHIE